MALRLRGLAGVDARSVPLPHGTDVVTRVPREVAGRTVPQGATGRVVGTRGDTLVIALPGIGTVEYARDDLVPRRAGQVGFAVRREVAFRALEPCIVLRARVGSHAWGLADESSDEDERGVFVPPLGWTVGLIAAPEDLVSADGSATYWSAAKAVRQALRADPNTLETLFVPGARATDELGERLLAARDAFVSVGIHAAFGRYAVAQLRRLEQGARLAEHRGVVLTWLRDDPTMTLDQVSSRLADVSLVVTPTRDDAVRRAKEWVKQLYRSLADQGLLPANDFASLVNFATDRASDLELPRELRPKNAYNLLRLIWTATEWLRAGVPCFAPTGPFRDRLLAIKRGDVPLADVLAEAEALIPDLDTARAASSLPATADVARADAALHWIGEEVARRFSANAPGTWGSDAPPAPLAAWEET